MAMKFSAAISVLKMPIGSPAKYTTKQLNMKFSYNNCYGSGTGFTLSPPFLLAAELADITTMSGKDIH
jgi:hypothetical protein